ncbi:MAG: response regulator [Anaerolineae bacterium]|nr:response regulator [Anaerolineae bacterium]
MSKGRILVVEDDFDISNMLRIYFQSQDYEVSVAPRGGDALEMCRQQLPHVVVLDIMLPDIDGYEVCTQLRSNLRTSHIPIIFLTQKDERSDKIHGLELGADDYITKPFDVEELKLRVKNAMARATYESLTNPTTGLPSAKMIEEQLRGLMRRAEWGVLYVGINRLEAFSDVYGFVAADEVLRFAALVMSETVDVLGTPNDFIGHIGGDDFIIITEKTLANTIADGLVKRFDEGVGTHYDFMARQRGYIVVNSESGQEKQVGFMKMAVGVVTSDNGPFTDIREITEDAAAARRQSRQ